ncbi:endospore germination permease [Viridibacillus sp. YIM B01967]|uniref:Endospore germination permease n=1 Tax=Viridibacillus soli TaxID=2798301 RepID=A0ABS1HD34_9BACL|nr:endospore germination permease [Viridibacillus soli]MBK3497159.1 endospore germination permease [Viridibacillus soli]
MKSAGTISILHVIFLSMTVIGLKNHVTIIPSLLEDVGRDGWASVVFATVAIFPWLFLLVYIHKKSNQEPIKDWLKLKIGKVGSAIVIYSIAIYLLILAAFTMRETLLWITTTFLPETPMLVMLIIFIILCIVLITSDLQTIAMVNVLVLLGVVIFGFFVAFTNIQVKNPELLRPFFEHGFSPVLKGMVYPASGFVELILFLFLQHQFKGRIRWYHFTIMLLILMGLTLGPLIGSIIEFGPDEAAKQTYPAYEEWGLISIGRFIEHLDFFSIYQWLTGVYIRVGLILFVVVDLLNMNGKKKIIWKTIAPAFFFISLSLFLLSDSIFLKVKGNYLLTVTFLFFFILSLFLAIVAFVSKKSTNRAQTK